jgi:hypothetical protein
MALFGKLFEKKFCDVCGQEIKFLGNRKLEDGNLCKNCANKLSPWFSDRRSSTVEQIKAQLAYREENKALLPSFHTTRVLGDDMKLMLDEDGGQFVVTRAHNLEEANPDILKFEQVTGVEVDVEDSREEDKYTDKDGKSVSYNPPRYFYSYDFYIQIRVNHPFIDEIRFKLNDREICINPGTAVPALRQPNPRSDAGYNRYMELADEIKQILTTARKEAREEAAAAAAPKVPVPCPHCGANTLPDARGCCEYCGAPLA